MDKAIIQVGDKVVIQDSCSTHEVTRIPKDSFVWKGELIENPDGKLFIVKETKEYLCRIDDHDNS